MNGEAMNGELESLLSDYAAPVADDGFSDAVMAQLPKEVALGTRETELPWREALVSACLGGTGFAAWSRLSESVEIAVPQLSAPELILDPTQMLGAGLAGLLLCGWLGLQWLDG